MSTSQEQTFAEKLRAICRITVKLMVRAFPVVTVLAWCVGQFKVVLLSLPLSSTLTTLRLDSHGFLLQFGPGQTSGNWLQWFDVTPNNSLAWTQLLADINPTWWTPYVVHCHWKIGMRQFNMLGIDHVAVIALSLLVVVFDRVRRNRKTQPARPGC